MTRSLLWRNAGGMYGGPVHGLASHGTVVLAATGVGLFRSTDFGMQWSHRALGGQWAGVQSVACAPDGSAFFAATADGRLFRSADAGLGWHEVTAWSGVGVINEIAVAPNFAENETLFAATDDGLYRSLDAGHEWQRADFGMLDTEILCVRCAPDFANNETLWAGSANGALYRSRNAARSWRESGAGLADGAIACIDPSPNFARDKTVFAGLETGGVYASRDGGQTWQSAGLSAELVNCLAHIGGALRAGTSGGLWRLADGGDGSAGWQRAMPKGDGVLALTGNASTGMGILAGGGAGAWHSSDSGDTWQAVNNGLSGNFCYAASQLANGSLYCLVRGALARSVDDGQSWKMLREWDAGAVADGMFRISPLHTDVGECVVVDASDGPKFIDDPRPAGKRGRPPRDASAGGFYCSTVSRSTVSGTAGGMIMAAYSHGLRVSTDAGRTWVEREPPDDPHPVSMVAVTHDGAWHVVTRLPNDTVDDVARINLRVWRWEPPARSARAAPRRDEWVLLTTLNNLATPLVSIVCSETALFIGAQNSVVRIAREADGQLQPEPLEFDADENVTALARATSAHASVLLAATTRGVRVSRDDGLSWSKLGTGLPAQPIVALMPSKQALRAITIGGALWVLDPDAV